MRFIFVVLIVSVLSILAVKYFNGSVGGSQILASPSDQSAENHTGR